jgi:hypothetical protein
MKGIFLNNTSALRENSAEADFMLALQFSDFFCRQEGCGCGDWVCLMQPGRISSKNTNIGPK